MVAATFGQSDFHASNGWLVRWKTRHNIGCSAEGSENVAGFCTLKYFSEKIVSTQSVPVIICLPSRLHTTAVCIAGVSLHENFFNLPCLKVKCNINYYLSTVGFFNVSCNMFNPIDPRAPASARLASPLLLNSQTINR